MNFPNREAGQGTEQLGNVCKADGEEDFKSGKDVVWNSAIVLTRRTKMGALFFPSLVPLRVGGTSAVSTGKLQVTAVTQ